MKPIAVAVSVAPMLVRPAMATVPAVGAMPATAALGVEYTVMLEPQPEAQTLVA